MSRQTGSVTRVPITVGDKSMIATLANSDAARDFASLLPLTLVMNDLFRREKFAALPRATRDANARLRSRNHWLLATRARPGDLLSPGWGAHS